MTTSDDTRAYRLDPRGFEPATKRRFYKRIAWFFPILAVISALEFRLLSKPREEGALDTLPIFVAIVVVALSIGLFRGLRAQITRARPAWESYRLTITPYALRVTTNLQTVEILREEITQISATAEGLTVETSDRARRIFVPEQLIDFLDLSQRLSTWRSVEEPKFFSNLLSSFPLEPSVRHRLKRGALRFVLLWALLIVVFLAIRFGLPR